MGTVYFLRAKGLHLVKIGHTNGSVEIVVNRLNKIFPFGCILLHSFTSKDAERVCGRIRHVFKDENINEDWFNIEIEDVRQFIKLEDEEELENNVLNMPKDKALQWIEYNVNLFGNERLYRNKLFDSFVEQTGDKDVSQKHFKLKLDEFIKFKGFIPVSGRDHIGRYTLITTI